MADAGGDIGAREAAWWADWRARDFSWDGLAAQAAGDSSLQDYWRNQQHSLILEPGTQRRWTRFHCPLAFADGTPSPKAAWRDEDWHDLERSLRTRLALSEAERPCRLDGCVLRRMDEGADDAGEAYLWLSARWAWFGEGVDLRNNSLGLSDFQGAWLGAGSDFAGARQLQPNFGSTVQFSRPADIAGAPVDRLPPQAVAAPPPQPPAQIRLMPETAAEPPAKSSDLGLRIATGLAIAAAIAVALAAFLRF